MTIGHILERSGEETIWLRGDELQAFCDAFESVGQLGPDDWPAIRRAEYLMGQDSSRRTWLDEVPRLWVGQALGRDWYIPSGA